MATANRTSERTNEKPEGSQPKRRSQREDDRIRDEGEADSSGQAPIDPADAAFIGEERKS